MPPPTRWYLRSALVFLLSGFVLLVAEPLAPLLMEWNAFSAVRPVWLHFLVVGWATQAIFGVAYWMFPRHSREHPYGSERLAWTAYFLLNVGLILRAVSEPLLTLSPADIWSTSLVASAILQWFASIAFVANTWSRIKER
jgi:cbb3-type cytochrome oxidase subunit 1